MELHYCTPIGEDPATVPVRAPSGDYPLACDRYVEVDGIGKLQPWERRALAEVVLYQAEGSHDDERAVSLLMRQPCEITLGIAKLNDFDTRCRWLFII